MAALLVACCLAPGAAALGETAAAGEAVAAAHLELLEVVQGPAVPVTGSPALCALQAFAPGAAPSPSAELGPRVQAASAEQRRQLELQNRYFGTGRCLLQYPPETEALVTRATTGLAERLALPASGDLRLTVDRALETTTHAIESWQERDPLRAALVHSLAWEIGLPLWRLVRDGREDLEPLACRAHRLYEVSRPTPEERAALPRTLPDLARLADLPTIEGAAREIAAGSDTWVEVVPVSDSHAEALLGRLAPRIFFSSPDEVRRETLFAWLLDPRRRYEHMGQMPLLMPGLDAVLLLTLNVTDENDRVIPTDTVAFWQQTTYDEAIRLQEPDLPQAEEQLVFRTVRLRPEWDEAGSVGVRYEEVDQAAMAHKSFVEAMPATPGAPVTVQRGVCLRCHTRVVETFHPRAARDVRFTRPFELGHDEALSLYLRDRVSGELAAWGEGCAADR